MFMLGAIIVQLNQKILKKRLKKILGGKQCKKK